MTAELGMSWIIWKSCDKSFHNKLDFSYSDQILYVVWKSLTFAEVIVVILYAFSYCLHYQIIKFYFLLCLLVVYAEEHMFMAGQSEHYTSPFFL